MSLTPVANKEKFLLYYTKVFQKIIKTFLIEEFFHLPPVSTTSVVHLELGISPRIFEKIRNGPSSILRGMGETDS